MRKHFLKYSVLLSVISIATTLIINLKISQDYFESVGKDRAFFALRAALDYLYQYCIALFGLVALVLVFLVRKNLNLGRRLLFASGLAVFSIILVFLKIWRLFVWIAE